MSMDEIYLQYKPFLYRLAKKYRAASVEMDDLMQMAYIGLHQATESYNPDKGVTFMHYVSVCVNRTILRELDNSMLIRLPSYLHGNIEKYKEAKRRADTVSLDMPVSDDDSSLLADTVAGSDYEEMQEHIEQKELKRILWDLLNDILDNDQYNVMWDYYRLGQTISAIAEHRGYKESQVRALRVRVLQKLHHNRHIKRLATDYGYLHCYQRVGLNTFRSTWTSEVEKNILDRERHTEMLLQELRRNVALGVGN